MLTIIFVVVLIWAAWKMFVLGIKAAWGIAKTLCTVLLFPAFIFELMCVGWIYLAIPVLIIAGICAMVGNVAEA